MGDFRVKKIILPSGKAVEIVYFHAEDGAGEYVAAGTEELAELAPVSGLECCGGCAGDLVHPVDWRETADDRWELELRCPNCGWTQHGEFDQDVVEAYDLVLNEGTDALIETLEQLQRENMEGDIERFVAALAADHITPFDF